MENIIFVVSLGVILLTFLLWGFNVLPGERWEILATIPVAKNSEDDWVGVNLTYYGFFTLLLTYFQ
jgi:hypothetical protein